MKILILVLSLLAIPFSQASSLSATKGVELLAIDGQKVKNHLFSDSTNELSDGQHQVVVQYTSRQFSKSKGAVSSTPHIFLVDVQGDTEITVRHLNTYYKAKKAVKDGMVWHIINAEGETSITATDSLQREGFLPYSNVQKSIVAYNKAHNITLVSQVKKVTTTATVPATVIMTSAFSTADHNKTQLLMSLYKQASNEQRKAFRLWLLEQDMK